MGVLWGFTEVLHGFYRDGPVVRIDAMRATIPFRIWGLALRWFKGVAQGFRGG